ncbi:MAG: exodeoxyribonuclease VII large subunit [Firmicutes bacterium]|nr:exodeoxyribonuclease VII large subunit [Bacillota bacterium]
MNPIGVSDLTQQIKEALNLPQLQNVAVFGEVSNFVHHTSGHMYFSLKDELSRIKAVMFKSRNQRLAFVPQDGDQLIAVGSVGVYERSGEYQLYVEIMLPQGIGKLHLAFHELKNRLEKEGLFAPEKKLPIPFLPQKIAVITSLTGAALRDILQILKRRFPGIAILIVPAVVQGEDAPESITEALSQVRSTKADVVILGRGGGSFEELSAFNDEKVARAIVNCPLPVVAAVGHETDFTIADFAADLRAPTPSAAAELVVPLKSELVQKTRNLSQRMATVFLGRIRAERRYLEQLKGAAGLKHPEHKVRQLRQNLDELWTGLGRVHNHNLALKKSELSALGGKLETLSPLRTLSRGYAICQDEEGCILHRAEQVQVGEQVSVRLRRGRLFCTVKEREIDHG